MTDEELETCWLEAEAEADAPESQWLLYGQKVAEAARAQADMPEQDYKHVPIKRVGAGWLLPGNVALLIGNTHRVQAGVVQAIAKEVLGRSADTARVSFLQQWVDSSRERGFKWDTFTFSCAENSKTVRGQLDEQIAAGLREFPKY